MVSACNAISGLSPSRAGPDHPARPGLIQARITRRVRANYSPLSFPSKKVSSSPLSSSLDCGAKSQPVRRNLRIE